MPISSHIDHANDLTTLNATEDFTFDEVMALVKMFYDQPTKNALMDLTAASEPNFSADEIRQIANHKLRIENPDRIDGKTAIVAPEDLVYGLGRMFQSLSEMNKVPFEVRIFRTMAEAEDWLEDKGESS